MSLHIKDESTFILKWLFRIKRNFRIKVDSSFQAKEIQNYQNSRVKWHHDHMPLLKHLFARQVVCIVFFQQWKYK